MYLCYQSQRAVSRRADTDMVTLVTRAWLKFRTKAGEP